MSARERLTLGLGERSYDILIGENLIGEAGRHVAPLLGRARAIIVSDETVGGLHLAALERALRDAGIEHEAFLLPAGEATKDFAHLAQLCERILAAGIDRGSCLIALGGGVIGDITGFAAAVLLRGLDFVQIPTTLLAQVDSSVGGKTGINTVQGKNLVGSFHQPRLVLADTAALRTLPPREMLAGYAEVVKHAALGDAAFFHWLEGHGQLAVDGDAEALGRAVLHSCRMKADIVGQDEREAGKRALLNLGHTFGHALEAECGYGDDLLHGEAVAIGMVLAAELSVQLGHCPADDADRLRRHLAAVGLPTGFERLGGRSWSPAVLLDHMRRDKKVRAGRIAFVLLRGLGHAFVSEEVPLDEVERLLAESIVETCPT